MAFRGEPLTLMGEMSAPNTPCMGDVVLIDLGDGVFTGREPHTSHKRDLAMLKNIARTAAIASVSLAVGAVALVTTSPNTSAHYYETSTYKVRPRANGCQVPNFDCYTNRYGQIRSR